MKSAEKSTEIYRIDSEQTCDMVFIAACDDAKLDWSLQKGLLEKNVHPRKDLQKHFNKYGGDDMVFSLVRRVSSEKTARDVILECKKPKEVIPEVVPDVVNEDSDSKVIAPKVIAPKGKGKGKRK